MINKLRLNAKERIDNTTLVQPRRDTRRAREREMIATQALLSCSRREQHLK